jgi:cytochrome c biogenesis protein CcdA
VSAVTDGPYALALAAGMLATLNPCGFALLPTYVSLLVAADRGEPRDGRARALGRALGTTAAMTGGFVLVFAAFGLVITPLALSVGRYLPWASLVIGVALVGLGGWLLAGREVYLRLPRLRTGAPTRTPVSMALYGVSYAVASLSCTVGPFLALTTSTLRSASPLGGVGVFVAYAAGMGLVVGVLTLATALARQALAARLRRVLPYVSRAGGALLVLAGGYVAYYGVYELRVLAGDAGRDPVVDGAVELQSALVRWLDGIGPAPVAAAAAVLMAAVVLTRHRVRG